MNERFIKTDLDLLAVRGIHPRLRELYGRLALDAGKDGKCHPKHATLAKEIGLRTDRQVRKLLDRLRKLGLIEWTRGRYSNSFRLLKPDRNWSSCQTGTGIPISDRNWSSDRKDSSSKEGLKRGSSPQPPSLAKVRGSARVPSPQPAGDRRPEEKAKAKFQRLDADEPKRSPEVEFRDRLRERHGASFAADACVANVKRQLVKCGGLSFADFVAYDQEQTTGNHFKNPAGYYVHLAKELVRTTHRRAWDSLRTPLGASAPPPEPPRNEHGRCEKCNGGGTFPDGTFCECQLGRDLACQARRKSKSQTKPPAENEGAA